jgi:uncharacterized protein YjiS (DUF1127 family)
MSRITQEDRSLKVCRPYSLVRRAYGVSNALYRTGTYYGPDGTVRITTRPKQATLSTVWNGRQYWRTLTGKNYTDIGLSRKAGEFYREIRRANPKTITFSGSGGSVRSLKEMSDRIIIDDIGPETPPTADELYPGGYIVVQSNDGTPDIIKPITHNETETN